jgi:hypothetical protein
VEAAVLANGRLAGGRRVRRGERDSLILPFVNQSKSRSDVRVAGAGREGPIPARAKIHLPARLTRRVPLILRYCPGTMCGARKTQPWITSARDSREKMGRVCAPRIFNEALSMRIHFSFYSVRRNRFPPNACLRYFSSFQRIA